MTVTIDDIPYNINIGNISRLVLVAATVLSFSRFYPLLEFNGFAEHSSNVTVTNDNKAYYTQIGATVDDDEFQREWSEVKKRLCPSGLPSHKKFGKTIVCSTQLLECNKRSPFVNQR